jgi:breast cancer 2 susceptibility protein
VSDEPPDTIDDLYDELENHEQASSVIARASPKEASWLSRYIREQCTREREMAGDRMEEELRSICPPREVRNFRVLVVKDARETTRPGEHTAKLTVWDILASSFSEEGQMGAIEEGQRYLVR